MLHSLKNYVRQTLRRGRERLLPSREVRQYGDWIDRRIEARQDQYTHAPDPGLLSIITAVWDGSPLPYLRALATRIIEQNQSGASQWVLLDNGCSRPQLLQYLRELKQMPGVKLVHAGENLGITRGLRRCLEESTGRYILPVDADDLLDRDALRVVASEIVRHNFPPLLYTDEDKITGRRRSQPYHKPAWDPVLLLNSAYIAHLGVIDREWALALGAYLDPATEGSPDWDLFVRFVIAGNRAVHVPEIVYSWRAHANSTAEDDTHKSYVAESQRAVLQRFLDSRPQGRSFVLQPSPLFAGGSHWHFRRKPDGRAPAVTVSGANASQWAEAARSADYVLLLAPGIELDSEFSLWEAIGIMELHPDTAAVGGRILSNSDELLEAGLSLDANGQLTNPNRGRRVTDPGYFGQLWKQRTVNAVSAHLAVVRSSFLLEVVPHLQSPKDFALQSALLAAQTGRRIVYSPFLGGVCRNA